MVAGNATKHVLTPSERRNGLQKALSPEAREKRRTTLALKRELRREDVRRLRERGLVPLAISDALGLSDATTARYLRELEATGEIDAVPVYLSLSL